jgi:hypothetical protein
MLPPNTMTKMKRVQQLARAMRENPADAIRLAPAHEKLVNEIMKDEANGPTDAGRLTGAGAQRAGGHRAINSALDKPVAKVLHLANVIGQLPGTISTGYRLEIPFSGRILAISGSVRDGSAQSLSTIAMRIQVEGGLDLFSDGQTQAFVPYADLFPASSPRFPLEKDLRVGEVLYVFFQHLDPLYAVTIVPSLSVFCQAFAQKG